MTWTNVVIILTLISCLALAHACGGTGNRSLNSSGVQSSNQPNENVNAVRSNVEELGLIVNVPYETVDVVWKEDKARKRITAVLRFSPVDSTRLVGEAEKIRRPEGASISSETWFPAELIAQSEMGGDDNLNGRSYAADQFFQEPFSSGRIVRIENTDYFILELSAK